MQISFTFRNADAEDWMKDYVSKKLSRLQKYMDKPVEADVVLSIEKFRNAVEVNLSAQGLNVNGKEEAKEMTQAIDTVVDKIERQLKRHKEKIRNHKEAASTKEEAVSILEPADEGYEEEEGQPRIVDVRKMVLKPMSVEDAVLEMESSKNHFIVYRDISSENVFVIYRRDDGNYALIETNS